MARDRPPRVVLATVTHHKAVDAVRREATGRRDAQPDGGGAGHSH